MSKNRANRFNGLPARAEAVETAWAFQSAIFTGLKPGANESWRRSHEISGLARLRLLPEVLSEPGRRIVCFERRPDGIFCARQQSTLALRQFGGKELDGAKFVCAGEFMESRYQFGQFH